MTVSFASLLFVPGDRPDRIAKAIASDAEMICVDLEDAVADDKKDEARDHAITALAGRVALRINRVASRAGIADLHALGDVGTATVLVPMCDHPSHIAIVRAAIGAQANIIPLIETVAGLHEAAAIARAPGVSAIMFGGGDLSSELGVDLAWEPLLTARSMLIMAAAEARIPAIDVPFTRLGDPDALAEECRRSAALGFSAKAAIHPEQIAAIHAAFKPSPEARAEAAEALAAWRAGGGGAVRHKGRMIEAPFIARLQRISGEQDDA